ncbi:uncharacterized protein LOC117520556 [Thalassophryne amazonica]|uniref:uncharacterized protein LOC117520556 n=1 Tax=Thalassophryne amazonica TaxID=390379 RepID=UPI00147141DB|nr:uncharacterized protein LOC117520556 [Thalassophryne amazonica]
MEKFFTPVCSPTAANEAKPWKRHHQPHPHQHHHYQDPQSQRYAVSEEISLDETHKHHRRHQRYLQESAQHNHDPHRHHQTQGHHSEEDEMLYNHSSPVTFAGVSSSLSSSSSSSLSSSSSWYADASANAALSAHYAVRPQHSLSCSNIPDVPRCFREDDDSELIVFATIKHPNSSSHGHERPQQHRLSSLDQSHSRSDNDLMQSKSCVLIGKQDRVPDADCVPLYKTVSLTRSLAFSEEDIVLGVGRGPKRAVSSSLLPGKGILKNKETQADIRKAKSMEVLSPRVVKGQAHCENKGDGLTQPEIERVRENFVKGKLQFSAFLDEITTQVISPSELSSLGAKSLKTAGKTFEPTETAGAVKPQLPPKKYRESTGEVKEQRRKQHNTQEKGSRISLRSHPWKHSDHISPDKLVALANKNHQGSPSPPHYPQHTQYDPHHGNSHKDRRPLHLDRRDRYATSGTRLTDGTTTSPELNHPKLYYHQRQQHRTSQNQHYFQHQHQHRHPGPAATSPLTSAKSAEPVFRSESPSTKCDSSRARDTISAVTSQRSEHSGQHCNQNVHFGHSEQHPDTLFDADHLQALQEENADLQQNLLQTLVCIESLEAELQKTREELSQIKEKHKSLLETESRQDSNLHPASESRSSDTKYLLNLVTQLSAELQEAHKTIAALENINLPCLIKELLEKHFDSAESIQSFLKTCDSISTSSTVHQFHTNRVDEAAHDWLTQSVSSPKKVPAFMPWKLGTAPVGNEEYFSHRHQSSHSSPFSVTDVSNKKTAASFTARLQPLCPQGIAADTPSDVHQACVGADSWSRQRGGEAADLDVKQLFEDFMQQLQAGVDRQQQDGQDQVQGEGKLTARQPE